tara:strand:- start:413 stop:958 length:546 start_codon:yes stop_codon:yes gene_type:complete
MKFKKTKIKNLYIININKFKDLRGIFYRNYCASKLKKIIKKRIVQSNISINKKKFTLRGFHYQKPPSKEGKLINCVSGKIFNVTIDLRRKSETYGKIVNQIISSKKNNLIYVPPGCANAYLTLENNTVIHYLMTDYYKPSSYVSFNYLSKEINIKWPGKPRIISKKDKNSKKLDLLNEKKN